MKSYTWNTAVFKPLSLSLYGLVTGAVISSWMKVKSSHKHRNRYNYQHCVQSPCAHLTVWAYTSIFLGIASFWLHKETKIIIKKQTKIKNAGPLNRPIQVSTQLLLPSPQTMIVGEVRRINICPGVHQAVWHSPSPDCHCWKIFMNRSCYIRLSLSWVINDFGTCGWSTDRQQAASQPTDCRSSGEGRGCWNNSNICHLKNQFILTHVAQI